MNSRKLSAGDNIEAHCTRCRALLNHTIVAMIGGRVVRVECNTCGGVHNYHSGKEVKAAAALPARKSGGAPRATKKAPGAADRNEWEELRPTMEIERSRPYDMNGKYRANDLVAHAVFGLGVVRRIVGPNKMEVLFQTGTKLLRCQ